MLEKYRTNFQDNHKNESMRTVPIDSVHLDEMPHTPSMKVDRNTLKQMMK